MASRVKLTNLTTRTLRGAGAYLSNLAIEEYMPLMVGNAVYYGFGW